MRGSLHTRVVVWVDIYLNHFGTRVVSPRYEVRVWYIDPSDVPKNKMKSLK